MQSWKTESFGVWNESDVFASYPTFKSPDCKIEFFASTFALSKKKFHFKKFCFVIELTNWNVNAQDKKTSGVTFLFSCHSHSQLCIEHRLSRRNFMRCQLKTQQHTRIPFEERRDDDKSSTKPNEKYARLNMNKKSSKATLTQFINKKYFTPPRYGLFLLIKLKTPSNNLPGCGL